MINLEIKNIKVKALCDSGAAVSLMSPIIFDKLKEENIKFKYLGNQIQIQTLTNSKIYFKQCIKLAFRLQGSYTTGTFYVTNKDFGRRYQILLGYDYLRSNNMVLDFKNKTLNFKHIKIKLNVPEEDTTLQVNNLTLSSENKPDNNTPNSQRENNNSEDSEIQSKSIKKRNMYAKTVANIFINAHAKRIVNLQCDEAIKEQEVILLEKLKHTSEFEFETSIHEVQKNNKINIIITNNTGKRIKLNKGMTIGKVYNNIQYKQDTASDNIEKGKIYEINNLNIEEVRKLREAELSAEDFDVAHLSEELQEQIKTLLLAKAHAFSKSYATLGQTNLVSPRFNLNHDYPIQTKPYKIPQTVRQYAKKEIQDLLKAKIIERSNSHYAFPVIFVKKKQNIKDKGKEAKYRMAIDYRLLNQILQTYSYPIPDIKDILYLISGKKFYTVLDLHSAFFQIMLRPEDRQKLAFITEDGKYNPLRLAFGTKNSSAYFAELIEKVLGHFDKTKVQFFMDDVVIGTNSIHEMLQLLEQVLQTLINHNLTIEPSKMQICKTDIEFLGFQLNQLGYSPAKKNIDKIKNLIRPKTKKGVKSLLGLANYFRTLIRNYAEIVHPLVELTKEKIKFKWGEEQEQAFKNIQEAIVNNPTLRPPDFDKEFLLICDASKVAISSILAQEKDGFLLPIEFFARKLKEPEKSYPSIKFELLAIHESVIHFKHILWGRQFKILTDSKPITQHLHLENQSDIVKRWMANLSEYNFEFEFIEGKLNPADFCSRLNTIETDINLRNNLFKVNTALSDENIKAEQYADEKLKKIIDKLDKGQHNRNTKRYVLNKNKMLILKPGKDKTELLIAPDSLKIAIMENAHTPHFGFTKTYAAIKTRIFWHGMYKDIKTFCANCTACQTAKPHKTIKMPVQRIIKDYEVGSVLHVDVCGPLTFSVRKNKFILTITDATSRFLEAVALRNVEAQTILGALNKYFSTFGLANVIYFDNAKYFRSQLIKEYAQSLNIDLHFTSVYRAKANAIAETVNRILKSSLIAMSKKTTEWDIRLDFFKLQYNNAIHRALGFAPALIFFARKLRTPFTAHMPTEEIVTKKYVKQRLDHIKEIKLQALANQAKMQDEYAKEENLQNVITLNLGQIVYLKAINPGALSNKFEGPFKVIKKVRNNNYVLEDLSGKYSRPIRRNIDLLYAPKLATPHINSEDQLTDQSSEDEEEN